ncbi:uncharacterized protein V6R79_003702 [Siganus canaliculatus]
MPEPLTHVPVCRLMWKLLLMLPLHEAGPSRTQTPMNGLSDAAAAASGPGRTSAPGNQREGGGEGGRGTEGEGEREGESWRVSKSPAADFSSSSLRSFLHLSSGEDVVCWISMEMSPNTSSSSSSSSSSYPLPWQLWLLLFLAPAAAVAAADNATLLFDSGAPGVGLRNCSCSAAVQPCDEAQANALCRCRSVPRAALPPAGLQEHATLAVWAKELWVLEQLNGSAVGHLQVALCGTTAPPSGRYLALLGLRSLSVVSAAPDAAYPRQEVTVPRSGSASHVTFLDVAALGGSSPLKAYSVVAPRARGVSRHFPHLTFPLPVLSSAGGEEAGEPENLVITVVY